MKRKTVWAAGLVAVLLGVAGGAYWWGWREQAVAINSEKDLEDLAKSGKLAAGNVNLKLGGAFDPHKMMGAMVGEFFALPVGAARNKWLDDYIDKAEAARKTVEANGAPLPEGEGVRITRTTSFPGTTQPSERVTIKAGPNAQDSIPPELKAQLAEFSAAVAKRRAERGLPPGGPMVMKFSFTSPK